MILFPLLLKLLTLPVRSFSWASSERLHFENERRFQPSHTASLLPFTRQVIRRFAQDRAVPSKVQKCTLLLVVLLGNQRGIPCCTFCFIASIFTILLEKSGRSNEVNVLKEFVESKIGSEIGTLKCERYRGGNVAKGVCWKEVRLRISVLAWDHPPKQGVKSITVFGPRYVTNMFLSHPRNYSKVWGKKCMKNASMKVFIRHTQSELPWLRPGGLDAFPRPKWTDGARPVRTESLRYIMSKKKERKKEKHPSQAKRRNQKPQAWSVEIQKPFSPLGFVANEYPESPGRETREAKKHLQTSSFSLMQMRLRLIGIKKKKDESVP